LFIRIRSNVGWSEGLALGALLVEGLGRCPGFVCEYWGGLSKFTRRTARWSARSLRGCIVQRLL
jgi:hypothetical protein